MVRLETLPKVIEYDGKLWSLNMHVTAWNKLCVAYEPSFRGNPGDLAFLLSQVVEPDMKGRPVHTDNPEDIVDVKNFTSAVSTVKNRLEQAVSKGIIKIKYE